MSTAVRSSKKPTTPAKNDKAAFAGLKGQVDALNRSQAVIEFNPDGTILNANQNFLQAVGYDLQDIVGRHHSMFVDENYRNSQDYRDLWSRLNRGEFVAGEFKRFARGGREVWIQASYNPVFDESGKVVKVVKFATEITKQKLQNADYQGQLNAISKVQAVIEFNLDGTILTANDNFCKTLGYTLDEIKGRHHSMFADETYRNSQAYREFWAKLNRGEFDAGEYLRYGKGGKEVWIQASYNPILDMNGKPFKVVKYATDITEQKKQAAENARVRSMMDNMAAAVTYADSSFKITYVNPAALKLLKKVEQYLPVRVDQIVGQSIDIFHKNPDHQRRMWPIQEPAIRWPIQDRNRVLRVASTYLR
ncbi:MAG: PAS domain S-box protein [Pirellulales bacterium]